MNTHAEVAKRGVLAPMQQCREITMHKRAYLATVASAIVLSLTSLPVLADNVSDGLATAKAHVAKYTSTPQFTAPGAPFDAKACAAGKKMMSIPNNSANPFLRGIIDRMKAA